MRIFILILFFIIYLAYFGIFYFKRQIAVTKKVFIQDQIDTLYKKCPYKGQIFQDVETGLNDPFRHNIYWFYSNVTLEGSKCDNPGYDIPVGNDCVKGDLQKPGFLKDMNSFLKYETNKLRDVRGSLLCNLLRNSGNCYMKYIAEVVEYFVVVGGVYSFDHSITAILYKKHQEFLRYIESFGVKTKLVEALYPNQVARFQDHLHVEIKDTFYYRENLLNFVIKQLKKDDFEYYSYIDSHQYFENPYWWEETIYKLEKFTTIQMYDALYRLTVCNNTLESGLNYAFKKKDVYMNVTHCKPEVFGGAWGITKEGYNKIDHILDDCFLNLCDVIYCAATQEYWGKYRAVDLGMSQKDHYARYFKKWGQEAHKVLSKGGTFVRGGVLHFQHENCLVKTQHCIESWYKKNDELSFIERDPENYLLHFNDKDPEVYEYLPEFEDMIPRYYPL